MTMQKNREIATWHIDTAFPTLNLSSMVMSIYQVIVKNLPGNSQKLNNHRIL